MDETGAAKSAAPLFGVPTARLMQLGFRSRRAQQRPLPVIAGGEPR